MQIGAVRHSISVAAQIGSLNSKKQRQCCQCWTLIYSTCRINTLRPSQKVQCRPMIYKMRQRPTQKRIGRFHFAFSLLLHFLHEMPFIHLINRFVKKKKSVQQGGSPPGGSTCPIRGHIDCLLFNSIPFDEYERGVVHSQTRCTDLKSSKISLNLLDFSNFFQIS